MDPDCHRSFTERCATPACVWPVAGPLARHSYDHDSPAALTDCYSSAGNLRKKACMRGAWRSFSGALEPNLPVDVALGEGKMIAGNASYVTDADIAAEENPPAKILARIAQG